MNTAEAVVVRAEALLRAQQDYLEALGGLRGGGQRFPFDLDELQQELQRQLKLLRAAIVTHRASTPAEPPVGDRIEAENAARCQPPSATAQINEIISCVVGDDLVDGELLGPDDNDPEVFEP